MATMDEVRAILSSNADPAHKLDRLGAIAFPPAPEPEPQRPRATKAEPKARIDAA